MLQKILLIGMKQQIHPIPCVNKYHFEVVFNQTAN
jgi:hypothetical protein